MKMMYHAIVLVILLSVCSFATPAQSTIPNPVLYLIGQEYYSTTAGTFVRYRYGVLNSSAYPETFFAAAPTLPPCGSNTKASRTWIDVFDSTGKRLYGFCAIQKNIELESIWFSVAEGKVPPSWVYIELWDRQTNTKYRSNLAETTN